MLLIFFKWWIFFGCIHWCSPPLSFAVFFLFLFLSFSFSLLLFTVYSNTAGCSETLGMKSRLISDSQVSASSSFRTWGIDTFTWHPQFARLDKQGKTNAWSPANNNRSEWIQVRAVNCNNWCGVGSSAAPSHCLCGF